MSAQTVKAIYRNGTFISDTPCSLLNNSEVELIVQPTCSESLNVIDPEARQQILQTLLQRMRQTALTAPNRRSLPS